MVLAESLGLVTAALDALCVKYGFPDGEEFKWSLTPSSWMRRELSGEQRAKFYLEVVAILADHGATITVVIIDEDRDQTSANRAASARKSVMFFLERADQQSVARGRQSVLVADRPGGGRQQEREFLKAATEIIEGGTRYVTLSRIAHPILLADSDSSRLLQASDLVTSATTAMVAGNTHFAEPVFEAVRPLFYRAGTRAQGYGLKIFPDYEYANLFYWLLDENAIWHGNTGEYLLSPRLPYANDPNIR